MGHPGGPSLTTQALNSREWTEGAEQKGKSERFQVGEGFDTLKLGLRWRSKHEV